MQNSEATSTVGTAETARRLHIDRSTLTRWVKAGKIAPVLRGSGTTGEMFFHESDVAALTPAAPAESAPSEADSAGAFSRPG